MNWRAVVPEFKKSIQKQIMWSRIVSFVDELNDDDEYLSDEDYKSGDTGTPSTDEVRMIKSELQKSELSFVLSNRYKEKVTSSSYIWELSKKFLKKKNPLNTISNLLNLIVQCFCIAFFTLIYKFSMIGKSLA